MMTFGVLWQKISVHFRKISCFTFKFKEYCITIESLKYEKEPEVRINADDGEAPFTCPDTAFALKIHAMEIHKRGLKGRIQHEFQRQIIDAEMSYNREQRNEAQERMNNARSRSSSSSSNPEIIEAREEIEELEAAYEALNDERDELWTRYKRACNDAFIPTVNIRISEVVLMDQVYDGEAEYTQELNPLPIT